MRITIDSDDWYPVYSFEEAKTGGIEVPDEKFAEWSKAFEAFVKCQKEIHAIIDEEVKARHEKAHKEATRFLSPEALGQKEGEGEARQA